MFKTRLSKLYEKACRLAVSFYQCRGYVPAALREIIRATRSPEAFAKFSPTQPRVPAGSSDGGQWTDSGEGGNSKPTRYKLLSSTGGIGRQTRPWAGLTRYLSIGPFNNLGGGDVPKGPNAYIDFYGK